ncbi:TetR/AcrR family transcriptional regulator, partial [Streptomyces sp. NPDC059744]
QRQGVTQADLRAVGGSSADDGLTDDDTGAAELLEVVGRLVDRARTAGELRRDVTVADVLLVIATAAPSLPDAAQQAAASARLLDILLEGLRSRPA